MDMTLFVENLEKERAGLDATINYLRGRLGISESHAKAPGAPKAHGRQWNAADKLKMSRLIKARLAAKKRATEARSRTAKKAASARKPKAAKASA